jgi:dCMP deaminase
MRPSKEQYLLDVASLTAQRSTCRRLNVGCVLASEDLTTFVVGYNGGPRGGINDCRREEKGRCGCVHAEMNAVAKAVYGQHTVAFLTDSPCEMCAVLLVNAGVTKLVYDREYRITDGLDIIRASGAEVIHWRFS